MKHRPLLIGLVSCLALATGCYTPSPHVSGPRRTSYTRTVRSNCYSLLYDLLGKERNVAKILIIKSEQPALKELVRRIAEVSGKNADRLRELARQDRRVSLEMLRLPPGEVAVREALESTQTHELLHASGRDFQASLLLTQVESMDYAAHLARVAAAYEPDTRWAEALRQMDKEFQMLSKEALTLLRTTGR